MNKLKRIIIHWTAGSSYPNDYEKEHYHFLVDKDGKVHKGKYNPEDNINCYDGKYAAHTGGGNTGSIGVALCGMMCDDYPLTAKQCERMFKLIAELAIEYDIKIIPQNVLTHYEFGKKNPNTSSAGKIDITTLSPFPYLSSCEIGDFIRNKARWYYKLLSLV